MAETEAESGAAGGIPVGGRETSRSAGWALGSIDRHRFVAAVRVAFGLVWVVDATLKWLPAFAHGSFIGSLQGARLGQPAAVQSWLDFWLNILKTDPPLFAHLLALAESVLALCLLAGAFTNLMCVLGGLLSLAIWTTAEGFGGPYVAGGTDIGTSIIYVLVFALLAAGAAGGVWGADRWLRPRLGRAGWLCSLPARRG